MRRYLISIIVLAFIYSCATDKVESESNYCLNSEIQIYNTSKSDSSRINKENPITFRKYNTVFSKESAIYVNTAKSFQEIVGIGGSVTDASSEVFAKLTPSLQNELLDAYFSEENGISYSLLRTTIHSCDFSSESYTYIKEQDSLLNSFSIKPDLKWRIPFIKRILETSSEELKIVASPFSPPAFMKNNNSMYNGGKLLPKYYNSWALYYLKYIEQYNNQGIDIWAVTMQDEPLEIKKGESCIFEAKEERNFLKNHLGPMMKNSNNKDVNIIAWNQFQNNIVHGANTIFSDQETLSYIWGLGSQSLLTPESIVEDFHNIDIVNDAFPTQNILNTEFAISNFKSSDVNLWRNAELYGESMINNFTHGSSGFIDWNLVLDMKGGPNHVNKSYFSPIHADLANNNLILTPAYYYIGHFSKFIDKGARRISSSSNNIKSVAFKNLDGSIVVVAMNLDNDNKSYKLVVDDLEAKIIIKARSIQTLVF